jgi:hypothetical protein
MPLGQRFRRPLLYGLLGVLGTGVVALAIAAGCNTVGSEDQNYQIPGTPDACTGQVYYEVPASSCFTEMCTANPAYAECVFGQYVNCVCQNPTCEGFKPAADSPRLTDAALAPCEGGTEDVATDSSNADVKEHDSAPTPDAAQDSPGDAPEMKDGPGDAHGE